MHRNRQLLVESMERRDLLSSQGWDGPGLGSASLTYYIGEIPSEIDEAQFRSGIEDALNVWASVADVTFEETNSPRRRDSIDITFGSIDGAGGTLAQAYLPDDVTFGRLAGDIEFDSDESWEFGNARRGAATDIVLVAIHELGHSLGLEHTDNPASIMFPSVSPNATFQGLHQSDIDAILSLYAESQIEMVEAIPGDFDGDEVVTALDIDMLNDQIRPSGQDRRFDLNGDGFVDSRDRDVLVIDIAGSTYGDVNLDGRFNTSDLIAIFQIGKFENSSLGRASWVSGDWNGDERFSTNDLILAFQAGGYEAF